MIHPLIGKDLYQLGKEQFEKKDIVAIQANLSRRLEEKAELRECIINEMGSNEDSSTVEFRTTMSEAPPSWQSQIRKRKNNLVS